MKKLLVFSMVVATGISTNAQNYWMQKDSVKGNPKSVCASFVAGGEGYIVSGLDYSGFTRKMVSYDPAQDDWDNEQSMGGVNGGGLSRGSATAFSIDNRGYVCTGQGDNTNFLKDLWEYDPFTDTWAQKADFPGTARRGAVSFVIDNIAYVGTGEDATGLRKDFYKYDPAQNLWGNVSDFAGTPRKQAVGFSMGNQGYVGTGNDGTMRNDFWQYLVFQNMWVQKTNFPGTPRTGATGWGIFPSGYIATGEDNNFTYTNDVWEYNYFTNQWSQCMALPASGRKSAVSFVVDGVAYLGTGYNGDFLDDFYAYYGVVGVNENQKSRIINLYPNPAAGSFTIDWSLQNNSGIQLKFYSEAGADVSELFSAEMNTTSCRVTTQASAGNYWCVLLDRNGEAAVTQMVNIVK